MSLDAKELRVHIAARRNGRGPTSYNRHSDETSAFGSSGKVRGEP